MNPLIDLKPERQCTWVILEEGREETDDSIRIRINGNIVILQAPVIPNEGCARGTIVMAQMRFTKREWDCIAETVRDYFA